MERSRLTSLFALAVLVHVESLTYWFTSSDTFMLIRSSRVLDAEDFAQTFTEPMMHETSFTSFALFYRPLANLTYAVDYWLWGLTPAGYHATNLVLHGLVVVLAAVAVAEVTEQPAMGGVTGVLFALHPLTAEVVPVASRRHDPMMLIFLLTSLTLFVRSRQTGSSRAYWGSLAAYALALAAKEPALLFAPLVASWAVLDRGVARDVDALLTSVRELVPFGIVTLVYLAVRVAVLGGLGGYIHRSPLSPENAFAAVGKYVLSLWYPAEVIGIGASGRGSWVVVFLAAAVVAALILAWTVPAVAQADTPGEAVLLLVVVAGILAVPAVLAVDPGVLRPALGVLGYLQPMADHPIPYYYERPASPFVGLALFTAFLAAVSWALVSARTLLDGNERRAIVFFAVWLVLPVGLFVMSGNYTIRSGYPSLVPAMAVLAVFLMAGVRAVHHRSERWLPTGFGVDAVPAAVALLLVVPMVAATPLVHPYDGWESLGEVNRHTLTELDDELAKTPEGVPVRMVGVANGIEEQRETFPRVRSLNNENIILRPGAIEAWLELQGPHEKREVRLAREDRQVLHRPPHDAHLRTETGPNEVTVHVRYVVSTRGV